MTLHHEINRLDDRALEDREILYEIRHALITIPFNQRQLETLNAALKPARITVVPGNDRDVIDAALQTVDVAFIRGRVNNTLLNARRLKWVHCNHAGLEKSAKPELFERNILLTGSAGRSASALAEHALMFTLTLNFGYPRLYTAQCAKDWETAKAILAGHKPLSECTLGIVGVGHTGKALAERAKSLGMRVEGYRRTDVRPPDGFDRVYSEEAGDTLDPLLKVSDFVVLAAALTDRTQGLMGSRQFSMMKPGAVVINLARGALIDEHALLNALDAGEIAGAGLDTFTHEPLPESSPFWSHPKVLISPHKRPTLSDREDRVVALLVDNIRRFRSGSKLLNQLSEDDIYTRAPPEPVKGRTKASKYPLKPIHKLRQDIVSLDIDGKSRIDVFWKALRGRVIPSMSLFIGDFEVLRFDCAGPGVGHYHVADRAGFRRIRFYEQRKRDQIERSLFELEENLTYLLRQNPLAFIRNTNLDPGDVSRACTEARRVLVEYAERTEDS